MKTRTETVVTISNCWGGTKSIDIILPEDVTDWFVTDYDGWEALWYVKEGNELEETLLEKAAKV